MRKQNAHKGNVSKASRMACMVLAAVMAVSIAVSGCSKKKGQPEEAGEGVETEASMELRLTCYLTGTNMFTDDRGEEQTSVRFLVENNDTRNRDWVRGLNGKEYLKAGKEEVKVCSVYINDNCRYVSGVVAGNVDASDITYKAGSFTSSGWEHAGDAQYKKIGAIVEDGVPYFYTGCGVSTGISGERVMCVWLAGFAPDSMPVDGVRPQIMKADQFSLVTTDGKDIPAWDGMAKEPELFANEFGIEVSIQAEDGDTLMRSIARTGLVLRHEGQDGTITDFDLELKIEEEIPEPSELETMDEDEVTQREGFGENVHLEEDICTVSADPADAADNIDSVENTKNIADIENDAGAEDAGGMETTEGGES